VALFFVLIDALCRLLSRATRRRGKVLPETVSEILAACRGGRTDPARIVARSYARVRALNDSAVFISLRAENEALAEARKLAEQGRTDLPLYGVPVAVKDNIDAFGLPTTAACPAFSYSPGRDATAVARLREAGAVIIGKTNLDQFATGLVGLRSPYGAPRNSLDPALIPGGSSSGSAVAVATGIVPVALGTDTAGSGRVPALFQQHRRPQAEPRACLQCRAGAGVPHARLHIGVRPHHR
jgi:allophanate hydrolase